ncbi:MAG: hypothetical protein KAZ14_00085 [Nitrosomonas sp.]|nr:hypothetical protein [Nitrosomonas sp.]
MPAIKRKEDKETCPIYGDHLQLKAYAEENRSIIQKNHLEVMTAIGSSKAAQEELSDSVKAINDNVKKIAGELESVNSLFLAWNLLPKIAKSLIKILSVAGGAAIAIKAIIDFLKIFLG